MLCVACCYLCVALCVLRFGVVCCLMAVFCVLYVVCVVVVWCRLIDYGWCLLCIGVVRCCSVLAFACGC